MASTHSQAGSPLYRIPQELRDEIYKFVLCSTRLTHGIRNKNGHQTVIRPSKNSFALLRTCRRVHAEIGTSWLG
ncbi:hypothetical protein F4778DRAFT_776434 [Xylariomycetidae sp. FL2044]|nr:hypothetical protein F4778DRAFT_776434 [Xylariomycetidae sp. FL2044]